MNSRPQNFDISQDDDIPRVNCEYYSSSNFKDATTGYGKGSFSILSLNIRSCRKNFGCFVSFLSELMFRFTIVVLLETWLIEDSDYGFDLGGYKQINLYRNNFGGGIKVFYDEKYEVQVLEDLTFVGNSIEILTFIIKGFSFRYLISFVYRSPLSSPTLFNDIFLTILSTKFLQVQKFF